MKAAALVEFKDHIALHNQEFEGNLQNVRIYSIYMPRHIQRHMHIPYMCASYSLTDTLIQNNIQHNTNI